MSEFTPAMQAAMAARVVRIFGAIEINMPAYDLRLIDAGIAFAGAPWNAFVSRDPKYGVLQSVDNLTDGTGDEAPSLSLTLLPAHDTAATTLAAANMQGSRVRMWLGVVDPTTGVVVPDPYLLFDGVLDVATLHWG